MASLPWPYRFLSLTPAQVQERREILDRRGNYAQLSAFAVVFMVNAYQFMKRSGRESSVSKAGNEETSSDLARKKTAQRTTRQSRSWLNSPPVAGWSETRKQYLIALAWLLWLLVLSSWKTGDGRFKISYSLSLPQEREEQIQGESRYVLSDGLVQREKKKKKREREREREKKETMKRRGEKKVTYQPPDYLHLTKSLAHTAFSNVPIQVALSPKLSSRNPVSRLIGLPQTTLVPYHRLLGRLVIFPFLTLHAALYLTFFTLQTDPIPLLPKRLRDADVQLGITGITLVGVLWTTSSSTALGLRKRIARRTFYVVHVVLVIMLLVLVCFHVIYARKFVVEALTVYAVDVVAYLLGRRTYGGRR
jgi:hypothetical protein